MFWIILAAAVAAGFLGSMVGSGGGVLLVPILTLWLHVDIRVAVGASIIAVIATSTTSAIAYVGDELTNVRLGMTLELATAAGAVTGGITAAYLGKSALSAIFAVAMLYTAYHMLRKQQEAQLSPAEAGQLGRLGAVYHDPHLGRDVGYTVKRLPAGMGISFLAGNVSGLLGIGGGFIKVPAMTLIMGVPMKAAVATSNFMIGVTAVASAYIYFARGDVHPAVAVPTALGVAAGAYAGARLAPRLSSRRLVQIMGALMCVLALQMGLAAFGVSIR